MRDCTGRTDTARVPSVLYGWFIRLGEIFIQAIDIDLRVFEQRQIFIGQPEVHFFMKLAIVIVLSNTNAVAGSATRYPADMNS